MFTSPRKRRRHQTQPAQRHRILAFIEQLSADEANRGGGDVPGDYDGNVADDLAVYRGGTWYVLNLKTMNGNVSNFGLPDDVPTSSVYVK